MAKTIDGYRYSETLASSVAQKVGLEQVKPEEVAIAAEQFDGFVKSMKRDRYLDRSELMQGARELLVERAGQSSGSSWTADYEYKGKTIHLECDESGHGIQIDGKYVQDFDWSMTCNGIVSQKIKGVFSTTRQLAEALIDKGIY